MKTQINTLFRGLSLLYVALLIYAVFAIEWRWRYDITEIRSVLNWIPMYNKVKNWPKGQLFSIKFNEFYLDLFGNIMLFVPFPFFLFFIFRVCSPKKQVALAAGTSLFIEINQYWWGTGVADIDDVILNTLGGLLGAIILHVLNKNQRFRIYAYHHLQH